MVLDTSTYRGIELWLEIDQNTQRTSGVLFLDLRYWDMIAFVLIFPYLPMTNLTKMAMKKTGIPSVILRIDINYLI